MKKAARALFLLCLGVVSCSQSPGGGSSSLAIVLKSTQLLLGRPPVSPKSRAGSACSFTYESTTVIGRCYTPLSVKGFFSQATFGKIAGGAPVRILGGGTLVGFEDIFHKAEFDLSTAPSIDGEDNIQDGGGTYNYVSMRTHALEYSFEAEASAKIYHVRIPFTGTPPSSNSTYSSCLTSGELTQADTLGTLWSSITAQAGDILVCIKATEDEVCAASDYQWVDGGGNLQSTRPGAPKRLTGSQLLTADACTAGIDHPDVTWGGSDLMIRLGSDVTVSAAITGGTKTYTTASGSGTMLTLTIDVDSTGSLFVPDASISYDLDSAVESTILGTIETILPIPVYVSNNKATAATGNEGMFSGTATLSVH